MCRRFKARPKDPYAKLVPRPHIRCKSSSQSPTVPRPRWSGISLGQGQFGPCRELSAMGCSAQCPLCLLGCARRPVAELNGCLDAHWCDRIDFCTGGFGPTVPRPRWSGISLGQGQFGPCRELSSMGCSAQCPLCLLGCARRPVAELNGCPDAHWCDRIDFCTGGFGPTVPRPRWSGIFLGQDQFGPCRELSSMGCSAQCPLCLLGCVRRPVAELNGCPEAHWCDRIDFCTGGFGPTVPRPCWSGISLGQGQFGPCQQGPGRWTMG